MLGSLMLDGGTVPLHGPRCVGAPAGWHVICYSISSMRGDGGAFLPVRLRSAAWQASAPPRAAGGRALPNSPAMPDADASGKSAVPSGEYMQIAGLKFAASQKGATSADKEALLAAIKKNSMAPFYLRSAKSLGGSSIAALLSSMEAANAAELEKLEARIVECQEQEGETEVRGALAKSDFKVQIGEKDAAYEAIEETFGKTVAMGLRLDLLLTKLRKGSSSRTSSLSRRRWTAPRRFWRRAATGSGATGSRSTRRCS